MPLIHEQLLAPEDILLNVHITENNTVNGLMMFEMEKLKNIGEFDERLKAPGFEFMEFCFRFSANGHKNYYIMRNSCVRMKLKNEVLFPKRTDQSKLEYRTQIEIMVKTKQFKK
jgi:poly(A) polymerase Pap1